MNKYTYGFISKCPNNNESVYYTLIIETDKMIMVEDIIKHCGTFKKDFHESIADKLIDKYGGKQIITATHKNVKIETIRHENNA